MTMSRRARAVLTLSLAACAAFASSSAMAAPPAPWTDVTATDRGAAAAKRAAALFARNDVTTAVRDLRVYDVRNGDVVVLPSWVEPRSFATREVAEGGRVATEAEASILIGLRSRAPAERMATSLDGHLAAEGAVTAAAPYWLQYDSGCFAWLRKGGSYMAPCYYTSKLMNDGSSTRDYFALRQRASLGTEKAGSGNYDGWLMSERTSGSTTQRWEDWEPGSEMRGGCDTVNVAVLVKGVQIGISATACERWEPTLWEDPGKFRNKWNCDCWVGVSGMRQVASNIAVSVAQGRYPRWTISAGFKGW